MSEERKSSEVFTYTYSATRHDEILAIREKYLAKPEDKMEQLRRLDAQVTRKGAQSALAAGVLGCLIVLLGCAAAWAWNWIIPGAFLGIIGLADVLSAYPVYTRSIRKEHDKVAPLILKLTEELIQ